MQSEQSQRPESALTAPSSNRTNRLTRFIQKSVSLLKANKRPAPSAALLASEASAVPPEENPNPETQEKKEKQGYISPRYVREQRNYTLTEADLKNHVAALETALGDGWPRRHHSRYRNAHALLVCWADSDSVHPAEPYSPPQSLVTPGRSTLSHELSPAQATSKVDVRGSSGMARHNTGQGPFVSVAHQLADVFESRYGIQAQVWKVPLLDNAQEMLTWKMKHFVDEYGGPDNLLIFWYGGMAELSSPRSTGESPARNSLNAGEVIWYGSKSKPGITARTVTKALRLARADVFMLNDSPFAQQVYTSHINDPQSFELLGSGSTDPNRSTPSFTRTLALMLESPHLSSNGVSVRQLHRKLLDIAADPIYRSPATAARIPTYPVYIQMAQTAPNDREAKRSIILSRLDTSLAPEMNYAKTVGDPGVKIQFKLARQHLDVRQWKEWVLAAPTEAREVSVKVCGKGDK
ncbi:hypothetical protein F5B22DRAFT_648080 [Xylaria bambusicola]|uniref:uncharacterized protein n=1 Tax=Xylaria bambusicola TaxID=326684 RepID=UPI0020083AB2|nr:uncharacterized protein F5B22DRAFT_648080 [Xylaria bambusicola]KAI0512984.1 hypothetical protein F5B22DRAFT_648080 [Xylaria bambusicola]